MFTYLLIKEGRIKVKTEMQIQDRLAGPKKGEIYVSGVKGAMGVLV